MAQKLLTKAIERSLPALYSGESVPLAEKMIRVKFFNPCGSGTWFVAEGERQEDGDWLFFGLVKGQCWEWGYFTLGELASVRNCLGLGIERDMYFDAQTFAQAQATERIPAEVLA